MGGWTLIKSDIKEKLKLRKVCAHWIPHFLTSGQKRDQVENDRDPRRVREIVKGNETTDTCLEANIRHL
jgi:hypothetical protein